MVSGPAGLTGIVGSPPARFVYVRSGFSHGPGEVVVDDAYGANILSLGSLSAREGQSLGDVGLSVASAPQAGLLLRR